MNKNTTPLIPVLLALIGGIISLEWIHLEPISLLFGLLTITLITLYSFSIRLRNPTLLIAFALCGNLIAGHTQSHRQLTLPDVILNSRTFCEHRIDSLFPNPEHRALIKAITLGDRHEITLQEKQLFVESGTIHLMAVSGLHTGAVYLLLISLLRYLHIKRLLRFILAITAVWFYSAITGLSPSTVRAATILSFIAVASIMERIHQPLNILALAAISSLLMDPHLLYSISFQLSYAAYLGILLILPLATQWCARCNRWVRYLLFSLLLSFTAQLFTAPLLLYHFQHLPLLGILSNCIAIPITTWLLYSSFFVLLIPITLTPIPIFLCNTLIRILYLVITPIANLGIAYSTITAPPLWVIVLLYLPASLLIGYLYHPSKSLFYLFLIALLPISITLYSEKNHRHSPTLHLFNYGQQPVAVFRIGNHCQCYPQNPTNQKAIAYICNEKLKSIDGHHTLISPTITSNAQRIVHHSKQYKIIMDTQTTYNGESTLITSALYNPYSLVTPDQLAQLKQVFLLLPNSYSNQPIWQEWANQFDINISYIASNSTTSVIIE